METIDIKLDIWYNFIQEILDLNILSWNKYYNDPYTLDGFQWSIEITFNNGKEFKSCGSNKFPKIWKKYTEIIERYKKIIKDNFMETGIVYVVHNEWIKDPKTNEMPYKIGITKRTIKKRYYGLGLKMPGEFICDFAYEFGENYSHVESTLHNMLNQLNVNGEWFKINKDALDGIQNICSLAGGKIITTQIENEILIEIKRRKRERNIPVYERFDQIIEKWNALSELKAEGKAKKRKIIRIPEIKSSIYYLFRLRNKNEISIELGCFTKKYPNFDNLLNSFDGINIKGYIFNYPDLTKREFRNGYKGKLRTIISLSETGLSIEIMKELIKITIEKVKNECIEK